MMVELSLTSKTSGQNFTVSDVTCRNEIPALLGNHFWLMHFFNAKYI